MAKFVHVYRVLLQLVTLTLVSLQVAAVPTVSPASLIAIGDIHGDFDSFVTILRHTGLVDKQNHWSGGKTTLVQLGDLLDRGPKPREVMDLLIALETEASKQDGRVVVLLGNHEMMNIMGDLRYVTPQNYASFADVKSEERRKSAYQAYAKWRKDHAALLALISQPFETSEADWMARHPLGYVEQREALSLEGNYGKWLRGHAAVTRANGVIFLHGGISAGVASMKLDEINARIREEISVFDACRQYMVDQQLILPFFNLEEMVAVAQAELTAEQKSQVPSQRDLQARLAQFLQFPQWLSVRTDGPLWFRGYDNWSEEDGASQVEKILEQFNASHLVTGHTVQQGGRIRSRFGGKVFLIDTGMLSSFYPGGRASALEIQDRGKFVAKYTDEEKVLLEPAKVSLERGNWNSTPGRSAEWILGSPYLSAFSTDESRQTDRSDFAR